MTDVLRDLREELRVQREALRDFWLIQVLSRPDSELADRGILRLLDSFRPRPSRDHARPSVLDLIDRVAGRRSR
jgi:hypothetical protein